VLEEWCSGNGVTCDFVSFSGRLVSFTGRESRFPIVGESGRSVCRDSRRSEHLLEPSRDLSGAEIEAFRMEMLHLKCKVTHGTQSDSDFGVSVGAGSDWLRGGAV
jgi:hypothetical protein